LLRRYYGRVFRFSGFRLIGDGVMRELQR